MRKPKLPKLRFSDTKPVILFHLFVTLPCMILGLVLRGLAERAVAKFTPKKV